MEHKVYRYFQKLPFVFDPNKLERALDQVLEIAPWPQQLINVDKKYQQICLTRKKGQKAPDCYYEGNGGVYHVFVDGKEESRQQNLDEGEYSEFISEFNHTYFKEVYDEINNYCKKEYNGVLGRVRLMLSKPRASLSWHRDPEPRLHVPIVTSFGAMMIVEDEVLHMKTGEAWFADTEYYHSQFNGSEVDRIHIVASLYRDKDFYCMEDCLKGNDYY